MIISASYRTDIPAYYGAWLSRRVAAGWAEVRNPYNRQLSRVALTPGAVDGWVFWTKNLTPFLDRLPAFAAARQPFVIQLSILDHPAAIEPATPPPERQIAAAWEVRRRYGPQALVWRYDPILITDLTPPAARRQSFARLAAALAGATDEVVVSFAEPYRKTRRNLAAGGRAHGFSWRLPPLDEQAALVAELGAIAAAHGMRLTLCTQPALLAAVPAGVATAARCIDADRLSQIAGRSVAARAGGNRPGCACAASRDLGAYDTCAQGCAYCYAVADPLRARRAVAAHDPAAPCLSPAAA